MFAYTVTGGLAGALGTVVQLGASTLSGGGYPAITVMEGIPVRWTIDALAGSINGCNNRIDCQRESAG